MRRPSGVAVETSEESSLTARAAFGSATEIARATTTRIRAFFLPMFTSAVCESYSAALRASESRFRLSLPGRNAIDERSRQLLHRAQIRPNEQPVRRLLHHPPQRRQR